MIKFLITHPVTGRNILGIGLSRRNTELILKGKPIHFNAEDFDLPNWKELNEILIIGGETEDSIYKELKDKNYVTEDTTIHLQPKKSM
jgi:hypothetical protein